MVHCAPLACLDQVAGKALFGKAATDVADCAPSFGRPAERQPAARGRYVTTRESSFAVQPSVIASSFNALWELNLRRRTVIQTSEFLNIYDLI